MIDYDEFDLDLEVDGTIADLTSEYAANEELSSQFLRSRWIAQTLSMLRQCRYDASLSQKDIANSLGTKQPAISLLEQGDDISLGRVWDYLEACGKAPLQLQSVGLEHLRNFVVHNPDRLTTLSSVLSFAHISSGLHAESSSGLNAVKPGTHLKLWWTSTNEAADTQHDALWRSQNLGATLETSSACRNAISTQWTELSDRLDDLHNVEPVETTARKVLVA